MKKPLFFMMIFLIFLTFIDYHVQAKPINPNNSSEQDTQLVQSKIRELFYPGLTWSLSKEEVIIDFFTDNNLATTKVSGTTYQSNGFYGKPSKELVEFYYLNHMRSLGWKYVGFKDESILMHVEYYNLDIERGIEIKLGRCNQIQGNSQSPLSEQFCIQLWISSATINPVPMTLDINEFENPSNFLGQEISASTSSLQVPFFSQRGSDPNNNIILGYGNCTTTFHDYGCVVTTYAMIFNYYQSNFTNPVQLNNALKVSPGLFAQYESSGCYNLWPDYVNLPDAPNGVSGSSRVYNSCTSVNCIDSSNVTLIDNELNQGHPVHVRVHWSGAPESSHSVVIIGHSGNDYYINDPWALDNSSRTLSSGAIAPYVVDWVIPTHGTPSNNTIPLPSGTTKCADEGGYCSFSGTATVYYGANNSYFYKDNITNGINCNNATFGDPISGVTKACYYKVTGGGGCNNPSPSSDQVGLYTDANYCGTYKMFSQGEWADPGAMGFANDTASSLKVGGNVKAILCKDSNYAGGCDEFTGDDPDLGNNGIGDNSVSSLKVQSRCSNPSPNSDQVGIYADPNYCGSYKIFGSGEWSSPGAMGFPNDAVSSVKVGGNVKAILCKDDNYSGGCEEFTSNDSDLGNNTIGNDTVSSMKVQPKIQIPAAPTLVSPANNSTVGRFDAVTLSWNSAAGATEYYAEFSGGPGFAVNSGWTGSTSFNVGSTFWGGVYTWRVRARNSAGTGNWSETRTLNRKYGAPSNLSLSGITENQISLSWSASADAPANIDGYRIYRNGTPVATVGSAINSYTNTGLTCNTGYSFYVKAYKAGLESDPSETRNATTSGCAPGIPGLSSPLDGAIFEEGQSIILSWTDTGDQFYGEITGGPAGSSYFGWQTEITKNIGSQWAGYSYSWKVKAKNSVGVSDFSAIRTFVVRPNQPTNLTATSSLCNRVNLVWTDNSGNEQGYQIYRNSVLIATLGSNTISYQDNTVSGETAYNYTVYAYRGSIQSAVSNLASITTTICPPSNDDFNSPVIISGVPYSTSLETFGATQAADDQTMPKCNLDLAQTTVWYRYTPSFSGTIHADTIGSDYDTVLAIWTGSRGNLTLIECNDDMSISPHDQDSNLVATLSGGTNYYIMVGKYDGNLTNDSQRSSAPDQSEKIMAPEANVMQLHIDFSSSTPGAGQPLSPNSILTIRRPTFSWIPGSNATKYLLRIRNGSGSIIHEKWFEAMDICFTNACSIYTGMLLVNGNYSWQVQTWNIAGYGPWSSTMEFGIDSEEVLLQIFLPVITR